MVSSASAASGPVTSASTVLITPYFAERQYLLTAAQPARRAGGASGTRAKGRAAGRGARSVAGCRAAAGPGDYADPAAADPGPPAAGAHPLAPSLTAVAAAAAPAPAPAGRTTSTPCDSREADHPAVRSRSWPARMAGGMTSGRSPRTSTLVSWPATG